jgi:hypothetical protein
MSSQHMVEISAHLYFYGISLGTQQLMNG